MCDSIVCVWGPYRMHLQERASLQEQLARMQRERLQQARAHRQQEEMLQEVCAYAASGGWGSSLGRCGWDS